MSEGITSEQKSGLRIALDILSQEKRFELEWEWMKESDTGEYVGYKSVKEKIIARLKE
jgi:hypothetical protein